jgi:hypothetical protein
MSHPITIRVMLCVVLAWMSLGACAASSSAGAGWSVQAMPGTGSPVEVACSSAAACTAVGSATVNPRLDSLGTRAWRWNGRRWSSQALPNPAGQSKLRAGDQPQGASLTGDACPSARMCMAVGTFLDNNIANPAAPGSPGEGVTLAERWNGRRWSIQPTVNPAGASRSALSDVDCRSSTSCVAVGYFVNGAGDEVRTLAERWDGTRWSIEPTPNSPRTSLSQLNGVACWSSSGCIAVGKLGNGATLAERWGGKRWAIQPTPGGAHGAAGALTAVACRSARSCIAAGSSGTGVDPTTTDVDTGPVVERWNGKRWSIKHVPGAPNAQDSTLGDVSCAASNACTAVGSWVTNDEQLSSTGGSLADRFNGASWVNQTVAGPSGATDSGLLGVDCPSSGICVAVGAYTSSAGSTIPFAERYS